jgi:hypothetical protein
MDRLRRGRSDRVPRPRAGQWRTPLARRG